LKPNAELKKIDRPARRVIANSRFVKLDTIDDLMTRPIGI
jgi:hypothetical protein